jgi:Uma2 family endonuclease
MSIALEPETETRLPDRYEVVHGDVVELKPMSAFSSEVANRIHRRLVAYGEATGLGQPRMDMLFHVPLPSDRSRNRRPDVSFITYAQWPDDRPLPYRGNPMDVVPELIVEVASPTDEAEALISKAHEYLEAGARLVWLVYPRVRSVYAYESPTRFRIFAATDELDGGTVLPGFHVPMALLFPPVTGTELSNDSPERND